MDPFQQFNDILACAIEQGSLVRAVFSRPRTQEQQFRRVDVRPVTLRGQTCFQFAQRTQTQEFHTNRSASETQAEMRRLLAEEFEEAWLRTGENEYRMRVRGGRDAVLTTQPTSVQQTTPLAHDRTPNYLIPEGTPCGFLQRAGVMNAQGHVRKKSYRKFRQINHYLNLIRSCMDELPATGTIRVVDFGCGKSYLTFATHHLLRNILKRECHVTGLDLRPDVVATCKGIASELSLPDLDFAVGDIQSFQPAGPVQLTISLHACDTATDDALLRAVDWGAEVILAVPCCQHELAQLLAEKSIRLPLMQGVLTDRFSALATDAMRTAALNAAGYRADIIEFIETDHTPKNLMIRAVRRSDNLPDAAAENAVRELEKFRDQFGLPALALERMLLERGRLKA
jgi:SAM-dependent methyltransferase